MPLFRPQGVTRGDAPFSAERVGIFFAFDDIDGLVRADGLQDPRKVIEHRGNRFEIPDIMAWSGRIRATLPKVFRHVTHGLMDERALGVLIIIDLDNAARAMAGRCLTYEQISHGEAQRMDDGGSLAAPKAIQPHPILTGRNTEGRRGFPLMERTPCPPPVFV